MFEQLKFGQVVEMNGKRMRYLGDGQFEPAPLAETGAPPEILAKRFDGGGPILGGAPCD